MNEAGGDAAAVVVHATEKLIPKDHPVESTPTSQGEAHEQEVEEKKAEVDIQPGELS